MSRLLPSRSFSACLGVVAIAGLILTSTSYAGPAELKPRVKAVQLNKALEKTRAKAKAKAIQKAAAKARSKTADLSQHVQVLGKDRYAVDRAALQALLGADGTRERFADDVKVGFALRENAPIGVRLQRVNRASVLHTLGLRSGDILLMANGLQLNHIDNVLALMPLLDTGGAITLVLQRGTAREILVYEL